MDRRGTIEWPLSTEICISAVHGVVASIETTFFILFFYLHLCCVLLPWSVPYIDCPAGDSFINWFVQQFEKQFSNFFFSGQESRFWYILVLVTRLHLAYNPIPARLVKVSLLTAVTIRATSSMNPTRCITCSNMVRRPLRDFAINFSVYGSLFHLGDHFLLW